MKLVKKGIGLDAGYDSSRISTPLFCHYEEVTIHCSGEPSDKIRGCISISIDPGVGPYTGRTASTGPALEVRGSLAFDCCASVPRPSWLHGRDAQTCSVVPPGELRDEGVGTGYWLLER